MAQWRFSFSEVILCFNICLVEDLVKDYSDRLVTSIARRCTIDKKFEVITPLYCNSSKIIFKFLLNYFFYIYGNQ